MSPPGFRGEHLTDHPLLSTGVVGASLPRVPAYTLRHRHVFAGITAGAVKG